MNDSTHAPNRPPGWSMTEAGYVLTTRLDYYGQPYESWTKPLPPSYKQLWDTFKQGQVWQGGGADSGRWEERCEVREQVEKGMI